MKWSAEAKTCVKHFTDYLSFDDSYKACMAGAPLGTTGRLIHIASVDVVDLDSLFGREIDAWVGGKRYFYGDPSWVPAARIADFRLVNGSVSGLLSDCDISGLHFFRFFLFSDGMKGITALHISMAV